MALVFTRSQRIAYHHDDLFIMAVAYKTARTAESPGGPYPDLRVEAVDCRLAAEELERRALELLSNIERATTHYTDSISPARLAIVLFAAPRQ